MEVGGQGIPIFGTSETSAGIIFTNAQSRFASFVLDSLLGLPCQVPHAQSVFLFLCSCGSNACVSSKNPSKVQDGDEGVAGREGREKYFLDKGSFICPPGKL